MTGLWLVADGSVASGSVAGRSVADGSFAGSSAADVSVAGFFWLVRGSDLSRFVFHGLTDL